MNWQTNKSQCATILEIATSEGDLTIVLARQDEAETMSLYRRIERETGKQVSHILAAAGGARARYPIVACVHECPMYHKGRLRVAVVDGFWNACKETALRGEAVLVHCNNTFHRGPLAVAAIMVLAGYPKARAFEIISDSRHIYPGHMVPFDDWPEAERKGSHAHDLLECHAWLETLADGAANTAVVAVADVEASSAPSAQNSSVEADAVVPVMPASRTGWRCSSCGQCNEKLRQCWECSGWDCKSCSFWCTTCPKGRDKYTICGQCNAQGLYLTRDGKIWRCWWCLHGYW